MQKMMAMVADVQAQLHEIRLQNRSSDPYAHSATMDTSRIFSYDALSAREASEYA